MKKNKKRDVLLLCQFFYPENNSSATLPFDTASALAAAGMSVSVLCGMPKEYTKQRDVPKRETVNGVQIHRLRYVQISRGKKLGRLINFVSFTLRVICCLPMIGKHRVAMVYSNPPVLPLAAALANKRYGTKFVFVSYDIYPEIALRMGSIRQGDAIDRVMQTINRQVFQRASAVVALSDQMRQALLELRPALNGDQVCTLPNWAHETAPERSEPADGILRVGYFGNLGVVQDVETLLAAMERLCGDAHIHFLIAGHGNSFETARQRVGNQPNVRIEGFLTGDELARALGSCDCCVVTLREGVSSLCMPSKYYSYLQAGTALVTVMDPHSDMAREVVAEEIGAAVSPGDVDGLYAALTDMAENLPATREAGARAAALYRERYGREQTLARYTALIGSLLEDT